IWLDDLGFREYYERLCGRSDWHSADRKFFLRSLLRLADGLEGDTAECGAYKGASSYLICEHFAAAAKLHHVFDSFEGLSSPGLADGQYWKAGDLTSGDDVLRRSLSAFPNLRVYPGWIPSRFGEVENSRFCFVHIDVDLHDPTLQSLEFFYPRMVPGGVLLFDDYGFSSCPGARQATDEFMRGRPEGLVHVPTGQAFVVKR
ncbi:MAG: class I SAM-dependent methyltransferase, partial [Candidatus Wallbacteria bacterium]|nr:class I SAM-dependent methyltransferase [Candidatus Wallbacteria bacterium]